MRVEAEALVAKRGASVPQAPPCLLLDGRLGSVQQIKRELGGALFLGIGVFAAAGVLGISGCNLIIWVTLVSKDPLALWDRLRGR